MDEKDITVEACEAEIRAALEKYGCVLVFTEVRRNGQTTQNMFSVEPKTPQG